MMRESIAAIVIGAIMILSAAGFALNSAMNTAVVQTPEMKIPTIVTKQLTTEEAVYLLRSGKVIIEYYYTENCTDCIDKKAILESFAQRMSDFAVLQEVGANDTSLQIVGSGGKIVSLGNMTLNDQNLIDKFCDVAIAQPSECLMREF